VQCGWCHWKAFFSFTYTISNTNNLLVGAVTFILRWTVTTSHIYMHEQRTVVTFATLHKIIRHT